MHKLNYIVHSFFTGSCWWQFKMTMDFIFRKAKISDTDNLGKLIEKSAKSINSAYYSKIEIDAALGNARIVGRQLIIDNTYWIVENLGYMEEITRS